MIRSELVQKLCDDHPDLTLKGLAILHAEVAGGEPLKLGLT